VILKRTVACMLVPLICISLVLSAMPNVRADIWSNFCFLPSALNEEWDEAGVHISPSGEGSVRQANGIVTSVSSPDYTYYGVATNNWTSSDYIVGEIAASYPASYEAVFGVDESWFSGLTNDPGLPETGSTIVWVQVVAMWASYYKPAFWFGISENNRATYYKQSSTIPAHGDVGGTVNFWNVTAQRAWSPEDFSDPDIWLYVRMEVMPGITYSLEYLTFMIGYIGTSESDLSGFDVIMSIPGAFGTIGFIGMTICPAYAIMQWRQGGDGRVIRLIMSIGAMLVFFTLFLASLGA